jgi:hypothetical protein
VLYTYLKHGIESIKQNFKENQSTPAKQPSCMTAQIEEDATSNQVYNVIAKNPN